MKLLIAVFLGDLPLRMFYKDDHPNLARNAISISNLKVIDYGRTILDTFNLTLMSC